MITHRSERILLRPLREEDSDAFARLLTNSVESWSPWTPSGFTRAAGGDRFRRELRRARDGLASGTHVRLGGFLDDGELIGLFALNDIVRGALMCAHASWHVDATRTGAGLGTEGASALLALAFGDEPRGLGLHRVQAAVMPANSASLRVAEKAGFRREGLAARYLRIAGRWEDHVLLAVTREEWPAAL